jgi:MerR family copper efflux transcriptional regulator
MLIGKIARMANLSKDGIRHYERMGLIVSTPREAGGRTYRDYDASVLEKVEQIRQMQQLGFSLKEMAPVFEAYEAAAPVPKAAVISFLKDRLSVVRGKIEELQQIESYISKKLDAYRVDVSSVPTDCVETIPHSMKQRGMKRAPG